MSRSKAGQGHIGHTMKADGSRSYFVKFRVNDPETGNTKQVLKRGLATEKAASAYLRDAQQRAAQGLYVRPVRMTVREFLEDWLRGLRVAETTAHSYKRKLRLYVMPALGDRKLQQLTARQIDALYRRLEASGGTDGKPLSARTVRYTHMILRKALAQAVRDGLLLRNPTDTVNPPTAKQARAPEMSVWTAEQIGSFLAWDRAQDDRLYALWLTYATTGMRRGEALALRWDDLDLINGQLAVRRGLVQYAGTVAMSTTKTARARVLDLDPFTLAALKDHRTRQAEERLRLGPRWVDQGLIFAHDGNKLGPDGTAGGWLRPESVWRAWQARLKAFNDDEANKDDKLPPLSLHGLRHSWATMALSSNIHVRVVQERLGHSSAQITLNTYSHVGPTLHREAAQTIAAGLFG